MLAPIGVGLHGLAANTVCQGVKEESFEQVQVQLSTAPEQGDTVMSLLWLWVPCSQGRGPPMLPQYT